MPAHSDTQEMRRPFRDREEAGALLAERLDAYRDKGVLVLAIPRGGVPVAAQVADRLNGELDVVVARKLGAPGAPELAIGAVTANGGRYLNEALIQEIGVSDAYLEQVTAAEMAEAHRREQRFRGDQPKPQIKGRTVILVDDGLATGATMRAAVRSVRQHQPAKVIVAVPVGSPETCASLANEADEVICMYQPALFWAVGQFYRNFEQTSDAEVQAILGAHYARLRRPA